MPSNWQISTAKTYCRTFFLIARAALFVRIFSYLLFGCPTANFEPLSRGQPHSRYVSHCVLHIRPEGHQELRNEAEPLSPDKCPVGFEPGTFRFLLQHLNPLGHSPLKCF